MLDTRQWKAGHFAPTTPFTTPQYHAVNRAVEVRTSQNLEIKTLSPRERVNRGQTQINSSWGNAVTRKTTLLCHCQRNSDSNSNSFVWQSSCKLDTEPGEHTLRRQIPHALLLVDENNRLRTEKKFRERMSPPWHCKNRKTITEISRQNLIAIGLQVFRGV